MNDSNIRSWIGRTETVDGTVDAWPTAAMNATLDRDDPWPASGDVLPALYHWLYFVPLAKTSELAADGHIKKGGFMPPVALPRRMWVSSDITFRAPLGIGEAAKRVSTIEDIAEKQGGSGPLTFVTLRHEIEGAVGTAIVDRQTVVYREAPDGPQPVPPGKPAPTDANFSRSVMPTPALLFRYSALSFNGHRIHYDHPFTTEDEGYPGLVVHGPLTATLLADLVRREVAGAHIARFAFRAMKPLFAGRPFTVNGRREGDGQLTLWVADSDGDLAVEAEVELG
jgi:3-methylfumaryl-CoA hydratase